MFPLSLDTLTTQATNVPPRELDLISAAQRGDVSAFNQLVRAYQEPVYRLAFHVLDDIAAAEHATKSAFEMAYSNIKHWKGEELKSWLLRLAVQQCKRSMRTVRFRASHPSGYAHTPLEMGLAVLTPDERVICVLADVIGLSDREISYITNADVTSIRNKRSRARLQIRDVMQFAATAQAEATNIGRG